LSRARIAASLRLSGCNRPLRSATDPQRIEENANGERHPLQCGLKGSKTVL